MAASLLNFDNAVFRQFALYSGVVIVKTMGMSVLTAINRMSRNVFSNEEDLKLAKSKDKNAKINMADPTVERIRRCHRNDLENVIPFVLIGLLYVTTNPDPWTAVTHFRVFAASRLLHTVAYLFSLPQPSRVGLYTIGLVTTVSMAVSVFRNA